MKDIYNSIQNGTVLAGYNSLEYTVLVPVQKLILVFMRIPLSIKREYFQRKINAFFDLHDFNGKIKA